MQRRQPRAFPRKIKKNLKTQQLQEYCVSGQRTLIASSYFITLGKYIMRENLWRNCYFLLRSFSWIYFGGGRRHGAIWNACIHRNRTTNRQRRQHALNGSNSLKSTTTWVVAGKNAQTNAENEKRKENNNLYAMFSFDDIRECCSPHRILLARSIQQQIWNVKGVPFINNNNNNNGTATALSGDGTQIIIILYDAQCFELFFFWFLSFILCFYFFVFFSRTVSGLSVVRESTIDRILE